MNKKIYYLIILLLCFSTPACMSGDQDIPSNHTENETGNTNWIDNDSESAQQVDRYLSAMEDQGFSGAIIVSHGDEVVLRKGYGYANRETRRPYTPETIQTNGSITKQFTGAAILLLESRGLLSVDDSISAYLSPLSDDMKDITIHQLLTHSSGLPGGIGADDEPIVAETYLERLKNESLQFEPGSRYAYSNTGYSLLGMIVENVSGQSYESFLREELLVPAGMTQTGYVLPNWDKDKMAIGYHNGERWGEVYERGWIEGGPNWHLRANGGIHTTVVDMAKWLKTVQGRGVLTEEAALRWTTGYQIGNSDFSDYGYGWRVYDQNKWGRIVTHGGSNLIFEADFVWLPERDFFFYIQGNNSMVTARSQSGNILNAVFDTTFVIPPLVEADEAAKPELSKQRAGVYTLNGGKLELTTDDTRLIAKIIGQRVMDIMFGHNVDQKNRFSELNTRARTAMGNLQAGDQDALAGLVGEEADAVAATAPFLRRINQIGNLDSLHVIGTFANPPGSFFYERGPWTTFIYAEFENWNQYWNIVWSEDETFSANLQGPWPSFTLIPVGNNTYRGVRKGRDWKTIDLVFRNGCLVIDTEFACKESDNEH